MGSLSFPLIRSLLWDTRPLNDFSTDLSNCHMQLKITGFSLKLLLNFYQQKLAATHLSPKKLIGFLCGKRAGKLGEELVFDRFDPGLYQKELDTLTNNLIPSYPPQAHEIICHVFADSSPFPESPPHTLTIRHVGGAFFLDYRSHSPLRSFTITQIKPLPLLSPPQDNGDLCFLTLDAKRSLVLVHPAELSTTTLPVVGLFIKRGVDDNTSEYLGSHHLFTTITASFLDNSTLDNRRCFMKDRFHEDIDYFLLLFSSQQNYTSTILFQVAVQQKNDETAVPSFVSGFSTYQINEPFDLDGHIVFETKEIKDDETDSSIFPENGLAKNENEHILANNDIENEHILANNDIENDLILGNNDISTENDHIPENVCNENKDGITIPNSDDNEKETCTNLRTNENKERNHSYTGSTCRMCSEKLESLEFLISDLQQKVIYLTTLSEQLLHAKESPQVSSKKNFETNMETSIESKGADTLYHKEPTNVFSQSLHPSKPKHEYSPFKYFTPNNKYQRNQKSKPFPSFSSPYRKLDKKFSKNTDFSTPSQNDPYAMNETHLHSNLNVSTQNEINNTRSSSFSLNYQQDLTNSLSQFKPIRTKPGSNEKEHEQSSNSTFFNESSRFFPNQSTYLNESSRFLPNQSTYLNESSRFLPNNSTFFHEKSPVSSLDESSRIHLGPEFSVSNDSCFIRDTDNYNDGDSYIVLPHQTIDRP